MNLSIRVSGYLGCLYLGKKYFEGPVSNYSHINMNGKTVIITGAS
jgi:hypothetical protein